MFKVYKNEKEIKTIVTAGEYDLDDYFLVGEYETYEEAKLESENTLNIMLYNHDIRTYESSMKMADYQYFTPTTNKIQSVDKMAYLVLGLNGEAGEVADKYKKFLRGDKQQLDIEAIKLELGDVFWYLSEICNTLGLTLDEVACANMEKLSKRMSNDTIKGDGDNR